MYRVGYIDEEETWRNTFYQHLKGDFEVVLYDLTDESTLDSIVDWVFQFKLDMLVVDFRLDASGIIDFNADRIIEKMQERNLFFPMIVFTSHELDALDYISNANMLNAKEMNREVLVKKLTKIINEYYERIHSIKQRLKELEAIRLTVGLNPSEEDEYVEKNNIIDKYTNAREHISRTFYSEDTNKRLDSLITKTEELLARIPKTDNA